MTLYLHLVLWENREGSIQWPGRLTKDGLQLKDELNTPNNKYMRARVDKIYFKANKITRDIKIYLQLSKG